MIIESNILSILNEVLGQNAKLRKGAEAVFFCPKCSHYKRKLEVRIDPSDSRFGHFHCWVCEFKGKSFYTLFKAVGANKNQFDRLYAITGKSPRRRKKKTSDQEFVSLPAEFHPLWMPSNRFRYLHAKAYLKKRGVTEEDILRYNIGYCDEGEYKNRVIIPSYDDKGQLNFFISRAFYDVVNPHKGPSVPKNFVGFECFINWQYEEGITLCEGAFDALSIRRNAIPLFGKIIPDKLKERIVENHVKRVNMVLDRDAMKMAIRNSQDLQKLGVKVHLIKLEGKDPSVLGFDKINQIIRDSKPMTFSDLVRFKLYE